MTNLVGVARYLASHKDAWKGTLVFIGQPAEERGGGAQAMLDDGLFRRFPRPDYALALHVASDLPTGQDRRTAAATPWPTSTASTSRSTAAAATAPYPHTTIDPIVIAARLVLDLQTIVSREMKPIEPAVVTVGSIHGGTQAQHHRRRVQAADHGPQLHARGPRASCSTRFAARRRPRPPAPRRPSR